MEKDITQVLFDLKDELHKINQNITKLLERDKVQNKRIENLESEIKEQKKELQKFIEHIYKMIGFLSALAFIIPILLRIFNK